MNLGIRAFEERDRKLLRALFLESREAAFPWVPPGKHDLADFDRQTAGEKILVAELDGVVCGFASVWEADSFLHHLFIHPSAWRRGVGRALLAGCWPFFHCDPKLKCLRANVNATRFYLAQGWSVLREEEGPEGPYLLMGRDLEAMA